MAAKPKIPKQPTEGPGSRMEPSRWDAICAGLLEGKSEVDLVAETGASNNTIRTIKYVVADSLPDWRKAMAELTGRTAAKLCARLHREVDSLTPGQLPVAVAVMADKTLALAGEATARVEHVTISHDSLRDRMASLPVVDCESTPIVPKSPENKGPA